MAFGNGQLCVTNKKSIPIIVITLIRITYEHQGCKASEVKFSVRLHPQTDGEAIMVPMQIKDVHTVSENKDILLMEIHLSDLAPDEFEMEIEAVAMNTDSRF